MSEPQAVIPSRTPHTVFVTPKPKTITKNQKSMNVDFSKKSDGSGAEPVTPVETIQPVTTPAGDKVDCRNTHTEVATTKPSEGLVMGDLVPSFSEIILPRVNLVHSTGKLKDEFPVGAILYDQRLVLYTAPVIRQQKVESEGTPPVIVTFLGFRETRAVENVKGGGRGIICKPEEVTAHGGTLDYNEFKLKEHAGMKRFDFMAEALLAIQRPEQCADDDSVFTFEADGLKYALALYTMKASAFTVAKRTVFHARRLGCLLKGFPVHSWALSSTLKPTPDGTSTYWLPVLVQHKKSTPAFLNFAAAVLNAKQVDTPDAE